MQTDEQLWTAVLQRDVASEGMFVYAVRTTGVYCRNTCPSRRPKRENVDFFSTAAEAEQAGYRPCLRCSPGGRSLRAYQSQTIASVCRLIESAGTPPALTTMAAHTRMSPFHFHRTFKAVTGFTPREYFAAYRARKMRTELQTAATVTEAVYAAGYGSSSRFYAESHELLGMKPSDFRKGGNQLRIKFGTALCSLGVLLIAATDNGVCSLLFGDAAGKLEESLKNIFPKAILERGDETFQNWIDAAVTFVEAPSQSFPLPLDVQGTMFQQRVWKALRDVPCGSTVSYAELAKTIGSPNATRAVARACAANVLAVTIPCHRVIGSNGKLTGYRWGLDRKKQLLEKEGA